MLLFSRPNHKDTIQLPYPAKLFAKLEFKPVGEGPSTVKEQLMNNLWLGERETSSDKLR